MAVSHSFMKILLLTSSMSLGGAERVACRLANGWTSRGDQVVLMPTFSGRGDCFYEVSPDVRIVYLADRVSSRAKTLVNQIARLAALRRFIASERPDIVVSFLPNVNAAAVIASAGLGIPIVVCERTDPFARTKEYWLHRVFRFAYPFAKVLMVQTRAVASKFAASNRLLRLIWVIQNPVSEELLSLKRDDHVAADKHLLAVGRLSEEKQFDLLIRVFARLSGRHSTWSLRIVGEGDLRSKLWNQIAELGLESRIALVGQSDNISDELARADAFVLSSSFEGFPNALLEAMAAGLPCVAFDCPSGPREMTMNGQTALLVAQNDEPALELNLDRLMRDDNFRQTLGSQARESVLEHFGMERILDKWDLLFEEIGVVR